MSDTKDSPVPIPMLAAALAAGTRAVLLGYGTHLQPVMEKLVSLQETIVTISRDKHFRVHALQKQVISVSLNPGARHCSS